MMYDYKLNLVVRTPRACPWESSALLFTICMIGFVGKFFIFGLRASWGILKLLCTVVFLPVILIGMVLGGLIHIAFPLLLIGGVIALAASHSSR